MCSQTGAWERGVGRHAVGEQSGVRPSVCEGSRNGLHPGFRKNRYVWAKALSFRNFSELNASPS